jgi:Tfp pilus assembly protein PilO
MREILKDGVIIFIVIMIFVLGIGGAFTTGGKLDFWGSRLLIEKRRKLMASFKQKKQQLITKYSRTNY